MAITTAHTIGTQFQQPTVSTKSTLVVATAWTSRTHLYCDRLTMRVNGYDTAQLSFDFGAAVRQPGDPTGNLAAVSPLDIKGQFVRVNLKPDEVTPVYWYGYIIGEDKDRLAAEDGTLLGRRQFFHAVGLAYFFDRAPIRTAMVHGVDPEEPATATPYRIQRPLVFNGGDGGRSFGLDPKSRGNMHPANDANGYRCFYNPEHAAGSPPELWPATKIMDHLLTYHGPRTSADVRYPACLRIGGEAAFLDDWFPTLRCENRTLLEVLNSLANPQRGLCWWAYYQDNDAAFPTGILRVTVNSLSASDISLAVGGGTLPQNSNKETLNYDGDAEVLRAQVGKPQHRTYTRVVCRGARQTGTGTFGVADATLEDNWSAAADTAYLNGAADTDGYSGLSDDEKKARNDAWRRQEDLRRVFASFTVPNDWDGTVAEGSGTGDVPFAPLFPELSGDTPVGAIAHYWPGLRALPQLPVAADGAAPDAADPEHLAPFVIVQVADSPPRYQFAEKLGDADYADGTKTSEDALSSYHLYAEQDVFGVRLRSSRGLSHTLAAESWTGAEPTAVDPQLDWQTLRATLCVEADAYCEGFWPTPPSNVPLEELVIDMGDSYRLDYLAPGAITGLYNGWGVGATPFAEGSVAISSGSVTLSGATFPAGVAAGWTLVVDGVGYVVESRDSDTALTLVDDTLNVSSGAAYVVSDTTGRLVRDDRDQLTDFAQFAYEWYRAERRTLDVSFARVDVTNFDLGMMITTVGSGSGVETVNTVIGVIAYDFDQGVTSIQTIPANLDLPELLS